VRRGDRGYGSVMAGGPGADQVEQSQVEKHFAREQTVPAEGPLTLATSCACGHTRKDHQGLRMEATGRCLECSCEGFRRARADPQSREQMTDEIHAALDQLHGAREILASLRALLGDVD
jgi:hypothetical protein